MTNASPKEDRPSVAQAAVSASSPRLMSLDALRGFNMFWILGGGTIFIQLDRMVHRDNPKQVGVLGWLADQFTHKKWEGFAFEDLIFPLFVFIVGVAIVFSMVRELERRGKWGAHWRIIRRSLLLFALGVFVTGGLSQPWPGVQLSGVLHRIAWCYLLTALAFCHLRTRGLIVLTVVLLIGYWAAMRFVPIPAIPVEKDVLAARCRELHTEDLAEVFAQTPQRVAGAFEKGLNLCNYLDARFLPGKKNDGHYSNEGLLSTLTATATCLLGALAGLWLRSSRHGPWMKSLGLFAAGGLAVGLGFLWAIDFPVIKKVWTSSYVLVAAGYSAILLGAFYLVIDVWHLRWWCKPWVWIGTNSITVYVVAQALPMQDMAKRLVGGDVARWLDAHCTVGTGQLAATLAVFTLLLLLVRYLYSRQIFLRL